MGSGSKPSSPRAQEEEGGVTLIHLLSVLRSVLFGLDHDALSLFCSRPEAEIFNFLPLTFFPSYVGIARLVEEDG